MFYANTRAAGRFQFNLTCKNYQTKSSFTNFNNTIRKLDHNLKPCPSDEIETNTFP